MVKSIVIAVLLTLAAAGPASADTVGRNDFIQQCEVASQQAGNNLPMSKAICNCSAQMVSYVTSFDQQKFEQWTVDSENPVIQGAIDSCVQMSNAAPYKFLLYFGSESASIR